MRSKILRKTEDFIMIRDDEGKIWIEYRYEDKSHHTISFVYQRTRLIVNNIEDNIANCSVYWSDINNVAEYINGKMIVRLTVGETKLALEWYNNLLLDDEYIRFLMKYLLDKKRVSKYLEQNSNKEYTYIGGVREINGEYRKFFDKEINKSLNNKIKKKTLK